MIPEFCGGMWIDVSSILHFTDNVKVEFLSTLELNFFVAF